MRAPAPSRIRASSTGSCPPAYRPLRRSVTVVAWSRANRHCGSVFCGTIRCSVSFLRRVLRLSPRSVRHGPGCRRREFERNFNQRLLQFSDQFLVEVGGSSPLLSIISPIRSAIRSVNDAPLSRLEPGGAHAAPSRYPRPARYWRAPSGRTQDRVFEFADVTGQLIPAAWRAPRR